MRTAQWEKEKIGEGRYCVRLSPIGGGGGDKLPGLIVGGRGRWFVELGGNQWPETFKTINSAAAAIVRKHSGI